VREIKRGGRETAIDDRDRRGEQQTKRGWSRKESAERARKRRKLLAAR
jgi:hypothetical protein